MSGSGDAAVIEVITLEDLVHAGETAVLVGEYVGLLKEKHIWMVVRYDISEICEVTPYVLNIEGEEGELSTAAGIGGRGGVGNSGIVCMVWREFVCALPACVLSGGYLRGIVRWVW